MVPRRSPSPPGSPPRSCCDARPFASAGSSRRCWRRSGMARDKPSISRLIAQHPRGWAAATATGAVLIAGLLVAIVLSGGGGHGRRAVTPPTAGPTPPPTTTATTPAPSPPAEELGASVNRLFNSPGYTTAEIDAQLRALERTGATIARSD